MATIIVSQKAKDKNMSNYQITERISPSKMVIALTCSLFLVLSNYVIAKTAISIDVGSPDNQSKTLSQYNYMLGSWRINMKMRNKNGEFVNLPAPAFMKAFFHSDNQTLQTIFTNNDGAYSTDLRTYDKSTNSWKVQFINSQKQRWRQFNTQLLDDGMTTVIKNGYSGQEKFDVKTIQNPLNENSFVSKVYYSFDQGKEWHQVYLMTYERLKE